MSFVTWAGSTCHEFLSQYVCETETATASDSSGVVRPGHATADRCGSGNSWAVIVETSLRQVFFRVQIIKSSTANSSGIQLLGTAGPSLQLGHFCPRMWNSTEEVFLQSLPQQPGTAVANSVAAAPHVLKTQCLVGMVFLLLHKQVIIPMTFVASTCLHHMCFICWWYVASVCGLGVLQTPKTTQMQLHRNPTCTGGSSEGPQSSELPANDLGLVPGVAEGSSKKMKFILVPQLDPLLKL